MAFGKEESLKTILGECSEAIVRHLDAAFARIWTLSDDGKMLELQASAGMYTHLDGPHSRIPMGQFKIGMIAQERKPHLTNDVLNDPRISDRAWAKREGMASFAGYPLSVGERTIGVLADARGISCRPGQNDREAQRTLGQSLVSESLPASSFLGPRSTNAQ
jgi:GAF domain-containing protein